MDECLKGGMQHGVVSRLNLEAGFGYVNDAEHACIFVIGQAISNRDARRLAVGKTVQFKLGAPDRLVELVVD